MNTSVDSKKNDEGKWVGDPSVRNILETLSRALYHDRDFDRSEKDKEVQENGTA